MTTNTSQVIMSYVLYNPAQPYYSEVPLAIEENYILNFCGEKSIQSADIESSILSNLLP